VPFLKKLLKNELTKSIFLLIIDIRIGGIMKRSIVLLLVASFLGACLSIKNETSLDAQTTISQNIIFDFKGWIGVIVNNKAQFYYYDYWSDKSWIAIPGEEMVLPNGYESVFQFYDSTIGVVVNNKVQFYRNDYDEGWIDVPEFEMTLPYGYKNIFEFSYGTIGVVVNNKVQFYRYDNDENWIAVSELEMTLPYGYENIFGFDSGIIGVVVNNEVQFYEHYFDWITNPERSMALPDGYRNVFDFAPRIGVIIDNRVQFYIQDINDGKWVIFPELEMVLPYGF
jgi:hypothetical protein